MKRFSAACALFMVLLASAFYTLRGESTLPDIVLESVKLLKKPIEDLLPDLKEEDPNTVEAIMQASLDLEPYQQLTGQRERWNEMRALIEAGQPLFGPLPSEIAISTSPRGRLAPTVPPPPGFTVQLPYESRLTVSGRKTIGFIYRSSNFSNASFATNQGLTSSQSAFELTQSLQVRINGQIGRKVTINVDFDDTKEDKKDISIVYKGDPDELVQRAAFGDITLSLPQTEFAGYSKQVFGAAAELKYKALKGYFIGSRTKGQTETKEFVGNITLQRINVPDTAYQRRRFYNYTKLNGREGDKTNNFSLLDMKVYADTQDNTRSTSTFKNPPLVIDGSFLSPALTYGGNFVQLAQGVDYTVDPSSGIITFRNTLDKRTVIAINYKVPTTGAYLVPNETHAALLKYSEDETPAIPQTEELTHYSIGVTKIVRDNAQGNFTMQLRDLSDSFIGNTVGVRYLPNNAGEIQVDFEQGTFILRDRLTAFDSRFESTYNTSPTSNGTFFVEFRSRVKTYVLRPNIVLGSERITLNSRQLTRDVDYFIDYESGFITFFNEDQITEDSRIRATYDFSPFGIAGAQQDTLVGSRAEVSLYPIHPILGQSLIGSTVIYDFAPKQTSAPDIRQTAGSFLVAEADAAFKDLIFNPLPFLKTSFATEVARSQRDPNTFGKALIDNMEGIKDETSVSLNKLTWIIAANPNSTGSTYANAIGIVHNSNLAGDNLTNDRVRTLDINPQASALDGDETLVLNINYNLLQSAEASIVTTLSRSGLDFSKKQFLEMWVQGDGSNALDPLNPSRTEMNITLGQISEDSDGRGGGDFTDARGIHNLGDGTPRTEDLNYNNTLDVNEDIGWKFINPDNSSVQIGADNLVLDSQDLDRNGIMDSNNPSIGGDIGYNPGRIAEISFESGTTPASGRNTVDHGGWKFVRIPLNISSDTLSSERWSSIKHMRLTLKPGAGPKQGTIRIAKLAVVGNRWQADGSEVPGSSMTVKAINTEDDSPPYFSPSGGDFDELNQVNTALSGPTPTQRREQALALQYQFATGASETLSAKSVTVSPMDFTQYGNIRMYVHGDNSGRTFFYRVGSDTDYLEFSLPINWTGWQQIYIRQASPGEGQRPNRWESDPRNPTPGTVTVGGSPNLANVQQQRVGIRSTTAGTGEIWVNEIYGADVITRVGYAAKIGGDMEWFGWGKMGLTIRDIDRNFETFTSAVANQDRHEADAFLNIDRLKWFPMNFTGSKKRTITPAINTVIGSSLVSFLEEGRVDQKTFSAQGTLQVPRWPKIGLLYNSDDIKTQELFRRDRTDKYDSTLDYTVPINKRWLPKTISLGYRISKLNIDYGDRALDNASDPFNVSDTRDDTRDLTAKMSFQPLNSFTFNPNYSLSTTSEEKDVIFSTGVAGSSTTLSYDKRRYQVAGFDSVMGFARWFSPRLRYSINTTETFGIPIASQVDAAREKTVDRQSTGEAAWDFAWRDMAFNFAKKTRFLQSFNSVTTFLVEDGDTWEKVDGSYNSLLDLVVQDALSSGNRKQLTQRQTLRSTQRWIPFDWTTWAGPLLPFKTMSLTSTYTGTQQKSETTGTPTKVNTRILPDLIFSFSQTEQWLRAQRFMSNTQMNVRTQQQRVDTEAVSLRKATTWGGDWRLTLWRKFDTFLTYTRVTDVTEDKVNNVTSSDSTNETLGAQVGFNMGKWRFTPKYDQTKQKTVDSSGNPTADLTTRAPAVQAYADLYLPAGMRLPFGDLVIFSNRIRTTNTIGLTQRRSSLNELRDNSDTYAFTSTNDYEMTSNIRLTVGGGYSYLNNKASSEANQYSYELNSLLTIQF